MVNRAGVRPGEPAPAGGAYRLLNVFGTATESVATVAIGERLPDAPNGYTWRLVETKAN